jgi:hypothetical protein
VEEKLRACEVVGTASLWAVRQSEDIIVILMIDERSEVVSTMMSY